MGNGHNNISIIFSVCVYFFLLLLPPPAAVGGNFVAVPVFANISRIVCTRNSLKSRVGFYSDSPLLYNNSSVCCSLHGEMTFRIICKFGKSARGPIKHMVMNISRAALGKRTEGVRLWRFRISNSRSAVQCVVFICIL